MEEAGEGEREVGGYGVSGQERKIIGLKGTFRLASGTSSTPLIGAHRHDMVFAICERIYLTATFVEMVWYHDVGTVFLAKSDAAGSQNRDVESQPAPRRFISHPVTTLLLL